MRGPVCPADRQKQVWAPQAFRPALPKPGSSCVSEVALEESSTTEELETWCLRLPNANGASEEKINISQNFETVLGGVQGQSKKVHVNLALSKPQCPN